MRWPTSGYAANADVARGCRYRAGAGRADLRTLLARWSAAAAVLQQGKPVGSVQPQVDVQTPADTGEAYGLSPASLTVAVGLGPSLFGDRFGLAARRPAAFTDLPSLNGDNLDPRLHGGDLSVQACADDPQVCYHAVRNLARLGRNIVSPYWAVLGFGRASAGPASTPRETCWGSRTVPATSPPMRSTTDLCASTIATNPG